MASNDDGLIEVICLAINSSIMRGCKYRRNKAMYFRMQADCHIKYARKQIMQAVLRNKCGAFDVGSEKK